MNDRMCVSWLFYEPAPLDYYYDDGNHDDAVISGIRLPTESRPPGARSLPETWEPSIMAEALFGFHKFQLWYDLHTNLTDVKMFRLIYCRVMSMGFHSSETPN